MSVSIPFFPLPIMKFAAVLRTTLAPAAEIVRSVLIVLLVTGPEGAPKTATFSATNGAATMTTAAPEAPTMPAHRRMAGAKPRVCTVLTRCLNRMSATTGPTSMSTVPLAR